MGTSLGGGDKSHSGYSEGCTIVYFKYVNYGLCDL